jgi:hypothetical protein
MDWTGRLPEGEGQSIVVRTVGTGWRLGSPDRLVFQETGSCSVTAQATPS